ncbi:unnamed protein product [Caenorhabditis auriculariae]|uniref:Cadherin domain-containing protein n=1 Tax=Caenorhabditis auriculariae TaxID=2777116 RepID=A0A8S1HJQ4_9PELO|nr:unnamed protein product [Caenorhabditis auriculariae]
MEAGGLLVEPSFLLVTEDWSLDEPLPITICPANVKIISGDSGGYFSVVKLNETCSTLQLKQNLDADKESSDGPRGQSFSLVLAGPRKSRAALEIQVVDVNDNPPQFFNTPSTATLSENSEIGKEVQKIRTRDPDTGISGVARFSVDNDNFSLDKRKCGNGVCSTTLRLAKKLDFEKQKTEQVVITAKDGDPHSNRTNEVSHTVVIHVTDEPDEPPVFKTDFSTPVLIDAEKKPGDVLMSVLAVDGDESKKNEIKYSIDKNDYVDINANNGNIFLKKSPPTGEQFTATVTATEVDSVGMSSSAVIQFKSSTVKEAEKQVQKDLCEFPIYEARLIKGSGKLEKDVFIRLVDGMTQPEDVKLIGGLESFQLLPKSENLLEVVISDPERVATQDFDNVQLLVKSSKKGQCRVLLKTIEAPLESSKPKFESDSFLFYVTENHRPTVLGNINIIGDENVTYSILGIGAEKFEVSETGEFRSLVPIDREKFDKFELTIRAVSDNGETTDAPCTIVVRDINDNSPTFEKEIYVVTVDEGKSVKQKITATDPDLGPNGEIEYSIDEPLDSLPVDVTNGIVFIGALDRDTMEKGEVNLTLRATDKGDPPRSSTTKLIVKVKDVNDNWPVFSNSRYSLVLDANISPGGVVGSVHAEDADATSPNNYIHYISQDPKFKITDNGELIFTGPGVLSKDSFVEFTVTATDGGVPPHNSTAVVAINEHKSSLQSELTTQVNSNDTEKRTEIKWDNAGMAGYKYEILRATAPGFPDSEVRKWISLDENTGRIECISRLDPDAVKQIRLHISMTKGKREIPVELIINVVDTDDVTPVFTETTFTTTTSEATTVGTTITTITAAGVTPEDGVKYAINVTNGPKDKLKVVENGRIVLLKALDFEKDRRIDGKIFATVDGKSAEARFSVIITDENDNRPIFKNNSAFSTNIEESSVLGTVLDLPYPLATDADTGKYAQLKYFMTGDEGFFKIDPANSTIRLVTKLDFETQRTHSLTIRCVDNDGRKPHHEVFSTVTVHVIDVNDNDPVIHNGDLTHLSVGEDAPVGSVVTSLTVTDADETNKQNVEIDGNHTLFRVDDEKKLVVAEKLHGYAGQRICSRLTATDSGKPPRSTGVPYCVTVYPAKNNHHNPLIVSPKQNSIHYFDENIVYEELLQVKVLEENDPEPVTYKLDEGFKKDWQMFTINANGSLKAKSAFDFEKKTVHEIKVQACRATNCSSLHLFISVNDRNDNCPMFPKQDVKLTVVENEKGQRQVGRIPAALDADFHSDNTKVCYTTESPLFYFVDPTLPVLYTNSSFDREQKKQHEIMITAYDCHSSCRDPHKQTNGTITGVVDVIDVNDNFPRFTQKTFQTTVIQGQATAGSHLLTITATDPDEEPEGLKYSIKGPVRSLKHAYTQSESPIALDPKTGDVSANEQLRDSSLTFTVSVSDGAKHEDTATVVISVVTYAQQTELVFDAPFDKVIKNEKIIVEKLSNATALQAVMDRCRQNSNFTLMLVHFVDRDGSFVNVDRAVHLLMTSNTESRRELRKEFGLREAFPPVPLPSKMPQILMLAALGLLVIVILTTCIWCRQRNSYEEKLRHISAQATAVHTVTLGRPNPAKKNPTYGEIPAPQTLVANRLYATAHPGQQNSTLQSTEL